MWTEAAEQAFQEIKGRLTITHILILPDFQQPFELHGWNWGRVQPAQQTNCLLQ